MVLKETDPYTVNVERRFNETSVNAPRGIYYGSEAKRANCIIIMSDDRKMNTHFVPLPNSTNVMKLNSFEGRERQ